MEKANINALQLFFLMLLFELGSAILVPLATGAKQDAWIAILLGMFTSFILLLVYNKLYLYYPNLLPTEYMQKIMGKVTGKLFAFMYILYFIYAAARVLRDFGEMLLTFAYPETPLFIANALLLMVVIYLVSKGIEVMGRSAQLLFFLMYALAISGFILVICSGLIHFKNLQPTLEEGLLPVLKVVFTESLYFPFGESIVFIMILPYLNNPKKAKMTMLCANGLTGINLAIVMIINISVSGVGLTERSYFPLLTTIQSIQVAGFLERLDVYFMIALVVGGFFKIGLFFYAAVVGTANLFKIKSPSQLPYYLGILTLFYSIILSRNFMEHLYEGIIIDPFFLQIPLFIVIPFLLLTVAFLKNRKRENEYKV